MTLGSGRGAALTMWALLAVASLEARAEAPLEELALALGSARLEVAPEEAEVVAEAAATSIAFEGRRVWSFKVARRDGEGLSAEVFLTEAGEEVAGFEQEEDEARRSLFGSRSSQLNAEFEANPSGRLPVLVSVSAPSLPAVRPELSTEFEEAAAAMDKERARVFQGWGVGLAQGATTCCVS